MSDLKTNEQKVDHYFENGDVESAMEFVLDLIASYCSRNEYTKAEAIKNRLYFTDKVNMEMIVKAEDMLEHERHSSSSTSHQDRWNPIYEQLGPEERNELYTRLHSASYSPRDILIRAGELNNYLFFLEEGEVKISCHTNLNEIHLMTCQPCEILGGETCFRLTAHSTFTARAHVYVNASLLHIGVLDEWKNAYPNLRNVLYEQCMKHTSIVDIPRKNGVDRRSEERIPIHGPLRVQLLKETGNSLTLPFKSNLDNISGGGLAFHHQFFESEAAQMLLGRPLSVKAHLPGHHDWIEIERKGRIVSLRSHAFQTYTFGVQFDEALPQDLLNSLQPGSWSMDRDLDIPRLSDFLAHAE